MLPRLQKGPPLYVANKKNLIGAVEHCLQHYNAEVVERPERVIGMHFMNPVPVMPLVEVILGLRL